MFGMYLLHDLKHALNIEDPSFSGAGRRGERSRLAASLRTENSYFTYHGFQSLNLEN